MKTYYLNLESAKERREAMEAAFPMDELIRVGAVDGMDWAKKKSKGYFPEWKTVFRDAFVKDGILHTDSKIPPNHAACNLSHISALEAFLGTRDDWAIILEDDVLPSEIPPSKSLAEIVDPQKGCDMLYLMGPRDLPGTLTVDQHGVVTHAMTLAAYAVSRRAAKIIIKSATPMMYLLDGQIPPCCFMGLERWVDRFGLQNFASTEKIKACAYPDHGIVMPSVLAKKSQLGH